MKFTVIGIDAAGISVFEVVDADDVSDALTEFRQDYNTDTDVIAIVKGEHENIYDPDEDPLEDEEEVDEFDDDEDGLDEDDEDFDDE